MMQRYILTLNKLLLLIGPETFIPASDMNAKMDMVRNIYSACDMLLFNHNFSTANWSPAVNIPSHIERVQDLTITVKDNLVPAFSHAYLMNDNDVYLQKNYSGFAGLPCYDVFISKEIVADLNLITQQRELLQIRLNELREQLAS